MSDAWTVVSLENQCQIRMGEMLGSDHGPDVLVSTGDRVKYLETQRERQSCTRSYTVQRENVSPRSKALGSTRSSEPKYTIY